MRKLLLLFLSVAPLLALGTVQINGKIDGYFNEKIELLKHADHLSKLKETLDADTISESGNFLLHTETTQSFTGYLRVADRLIPIHVQSGAHIYIDLKCPEDLEDLLVPISFDSVSVSRVNMDEWAFKNSFLRSFNTFLNENQTRFFYQRADSAKHHFTDSIYSSSKDKLEKSPYLQHFVKYTLAGLEVISRTPTPLIYDSLIKNNQLLYESAAYSDFVNQVFGERLNQLFNSQYRYVKDRLEKEPLVVLSEIFSKDSLIHTNERLKEYLILGFTLERFKTGMVPTEIWLKLMHQITQTSKFEEHREIAQNIIQKLDFLEQKELAPSFALPQENEKEYSLKDANGKFVYLQFWADWSLPSVSHMKILERIYKENNRNIEIISININRNREKMYQLLDANKTFRWPFVHFDLNYELLRAYAVNTAPLYVLLDPNGRILMAPADDPVKMFSLLVELRTSSAGEQEPFMLINDYEKERLR